MRLNFTKYDLLLIFMLALLGMLAVAAFEWLPGYVALCGILLFALLTVASLIHILRSMQKTITHEDQIRTHINNQIQQLRVDIQDRLLPDLFELITKEINKSKESITEVVNSKVAQLTHSQTELFNTHTSTILRDQLTDYHSKLSDHWDHALLSLVSHGEGVFNEIVAVNSRVELLDKTLSLIASSGTEYRNEILQRIDNWQKSITGLVKNEDMQQLNKRLSEELVLHIRTTYSQIESLFSLFSILKPRAPLPFFRAWAISPDLAKIILEVILWKRPGLTVGLGSGVSDIIMGYGLELVKSGLHISIENDEKYAEITSDLITQHGLTDYISLFTCPLTEYKILNEKRTWYDIDMKIFKGGVDLLVIDGPPGNTQQLARYPALHLLKPYLNNPCIVIVDDAKRVDEERMVQMWKEEFDIKRIELLNTEKGAYILYV